MTKKFDRRQEILAFERDGSGTIPNADGVMQFALQVPTRLNVEHWIGRIHVVERLAGRVQLARIADPSDRVRTLCTPAHHILFGPLGEGRPGFHCRSGETLCFTFEVQGSITFVGGVAFEPRSGSVIWFPMPGDRART